MKMLTKSILYYFSQICNYYVKISIINQKKDNKYTDIIESIQKINAKNDEKISCVPSFVRPEFFINPVKTLREKCKNRPAAGRESTVLLPDYFFRGKKACNYAVLFRLHRWGAGCAGRNLDRYTGGIDGYAGLSCITFSYKMLCMIGCSFI